MLEGHKGQVFCLAYAPDGATLASGDGYQVLRLWDAVSGDAVATAALPKPGGGRRPGIHGVAFDPAGRLLAVAAGGRQLELRDAATGAAQGGIAGHGAPVRGVAFLPDGRPVSIGRNESGGRGEAILWGARSHLARPAARLSMGWVPVRAVAISATGLIALGMIYGALLWSPDEGRDWSDDWLGNDASAAMIRAYDPSAAGARELPVGEPYADELRLFPHRTAAESVALSADGRTLAAADETVVRLWDVGNGHCAHVLEGHAAPVQAVALSPDGRTVASGSMDGTIRFWSAEDGAPLACLDAAAGWVKALAFAPDGMTLAAAVEVDIYIWDVDEALRP